MKKNRFHYPLVLMARLLEVSRSGYYSWIKAIPSKRVLRHNLLGPLIEKVHIDSRKTYGSRRIYDELKVQGKVVGRDQITRLRKKMGLICIQKTKFKATTNSAHNLPIAPNLLDQVFTTTAPSQVWGSDITYIVTGEGWLYLAAIKDFHTKEVVGQAMSSRMTQELVMEAFNKAIKYRMPSPGCIMHSDRGSQYCAADYQKMIIKAGMRPSMSRKGNCYDNAPTESLWSSLKMEMVYHRKFATRLEAQSAIQEYLEIFYNRMRKHSVLGNVAPAVFARNYFNKRRTA